MENMNIAKVAIDAVRGKIQGGFSKDETSDKLRKACIEINGDTRLNLKTFYRGSSNGLFDLVETIIPTIIDEGIKSDNVLMKLVEYVNIANGDVNEFVVKGKSEFVVANVANGIRDVRRQRMPDGYTLSVPTVPYVVRVYDGLDRFLAGRVDLSEFVDGVARSYNKQIYESCYNVLANVTSSTSGLNSTYVTSGSFSESDTITKIQHVEAANNGAKAYILGTKAALRKMTTAIVSDSAKEDMNKIGYYGFFNGTPMYEIVQAHKANSDTFVISDSTIYIIASDDKPIKLVNEGEGWLTDKDPYTQADLTHEYIYSQSVGTGAIFGNKMGISTFSA